MLLFGDRLAAIESGGKEDVETLLDGQEDEASHQRAQVVDDIIHTCGWGVGGGARLLLGVGGGARLLLGVGGGARLLLGVGGGRRELQLTLLCETEHSKYGHDVSFTCKRVCMDNVM